MERAEIVYLPYNKRCSEVHNKSKEMKEKNLEGNDLSYLSDPKQSESMCRCKSRGEHARGLCSLSTKTNIYFFLYQANHRMILAEFGGGGKVERLRIFQLSYL